MNTEQLQQALKRMKNILWDIETVQKQRAGWIDTYKMTDVLPGAQNYALHNIGISTAVIGRLWERFEKQSKVLFS